MRKLIDTLVLILLLLGPALVLSSVQGEASEVEERLAMQMHYKEIVHKPIANVIKARP